jgi:Raf kinase inhibitor-like YbhB/YbcL family protein
MEKDSLTLSSPAFKEGEVIPTMYTCKGAAVSPPLTIRGIPDQTNNLALIVHDPDAPRGDFLHWSMWNISPNTTGIDEDMPPIDAVEGMNDFGLIGYGAPCPPLGRHHYLFDLYALSGPVNLRLGASRSDIEEALRQLAVAKTTLMGIVTS